MRPQFSGCVRLRMPISFFQVRREVGFVLDDATVHIQHIQRAIGPCVEVHGAELFVGAGQEFPAGIGLAADHKK